MVQIFRPSIRRLLVLLPLALILALACTEAAQSTQIPTWIANSPTEPAATAVTPAVAAPTVAQAQAGTVDPSPVADLASSALSSRAATVDPSPASPSASAAAPVAAIGPAQVSVHATEAEVDFPDSINFSLDVSSALPIDKISLEYGTDELNSCATRYSTVNQEFVPGSRVNTSWAWEFKKTGSIPPGVTVWWRWRITDEAGRSHLTQREELLYEDLRFNWQQTTSDNITILWYEGGSGFGEQVATRVDQGVSRLELGDQEEKPIRAYIYASSSDVRGAFLFANVWTGGRAFLSDNILLIAISPDSLDAQVSGLTHELAHLLINEATFNCFAVPDQWLHEGLATYSEGRMSRHQQNALDQAVARDELISVRSLSSNFPAGHAGATLSYAQSRSLVEFLIDTYGWSEMRELLDVFQEGSTTDKALLRVYGFNRNGLNQLWRQHIGAQ